MQIKHVFILNPAESLNDLLRIFRDNKIQGRMLLSGFGSIAEFESLTDNELMLISMVCKQSSLGNVTVDILNTFGRFPLAAVDLLTQIISAHSEKLFITYLDASVRNDRRILVKQWDL